MERWKQVLAAGGLFCVMAALLILTLRHSLRRTVYLTLPETAEEPSIEDPVGEDRLTLLEITPETVQAAVATLERPEAYTRTFLVTRYWSSGSGTDTIQVAVRRPWTRVDRILPDGRIRHSLTDGADTWIWYDAELNAWRTPAGDIDADDEQHIPTYEDVLDLPPERIVRADYRVLSDENCIYVETEEEDGRSGRYWISVETGLLSAAERLAGGETVYRMESLAVNWEDPDPLSFLLPDGTVPREPSEPDAENAVRP